MAFASASESASDAANGLFSAQKSVLYTYPREIYTLQSILIEELLLN